MLKADNIFLQKEHKTGGLILNTTLAPNYLKESSKSLILDKDNNLSKDEMAELFDLNNEYVLTLETGRDIMSKEKFQKYRNWVTDNCLDAPSVTSWNYYSQLIENQNY